MQHQDSITERNSPRRRRKNEERREAGVGFVIETHRVSKLSGLPKGINDRLMSLRLPLFGTKRVTSTMVRLSLLTMTNSNLMREVLLFVCFKMANETSLSSKLPAADRT